MSNRDHTRAGLLACSAALTLLSTPACDRPGNDENASIQLSHHECAGFEGALLRQGGGLRSAVRIRNQGDAEVRLALEIVRENPDGSEVSREPSGSFGIMAGDEMVLHTQFKRLTVDGAARGLLEVRVASANGSGMWLPYWLDDVQPSGTTVPKQAGQLEVGGLATVFLMTGRSQGEESQGAVRLQLKHVDS